MLGVDGLKQESWRRAETKESAIERRQRLLAEDLQKATVTVEPDEGRDVTNLLAQMGKPMTADSVIQKLKFCNPKLVFIRAIRYPELYGIYLQTKERTPAGTWVDKQIHVCGMGSGVMPEFSVKHKRTTKVPNKELFGKEKPTRDVDWNEIETFADETRGWRTVLVRLLHAGLITRGDVGRHFGWTPSRDSKAWYSQTR